MQNKEIEELTKRIGDKIGAENKALINDDLALLITDTANTNQIIKDKDNEIQNLKSDKENLLMTNNKLFQQVAIGKEQELEQEKEKDKPQSNYSFQSCFDEKGNFKK